MSKRLRGVIPEDDTSFQGLQFPVRKRKKPAERIEEIFCDPVDGFARWTGFRDEKLVWDERKFEGSQTLNKKKRRRKKRKEILLLFKEYLKVRKFLELCIPF